jgi:uncharacterized membrane protein YbhN (UPF0104 family)
LAAGAKSSIRWLKRLLKLSIVVAILWGLRSTLAKALDDLQQHDWTIHWPWLGAAGALYVAGLVPCGFYWWLVLRRLGNPVHFWPALRAYAIGHVGKYAPGKGMVIVIRTALLQGHYDDIPAAVVAVFFETLTLTGAACALAALSLNLAFGMAGPPVWAIWALALVFAASAAPPLVAFLLKHVPIKATRATAVDLAARIARIPLTLSIVGWASACAAWLALGLSLWCVVRGLTSAADCPLSEFPFYLCATTTAFVAGFLSLLPGGAVAREAVLIALLRTRYDDGTAVVAAILLRLVWLVAEAGQSAILYLLRAPVPQRPTV